VPVPLVVGLGEAVALAVGEWRSEAARLRGLRDRLQAGITGHVPATRVNGHPTQRLPGNLSLSFAGVDGEALMMAMRDVAVSSGAACTSANPEPSHVLRAMGLTEELARASLRFGLGRFTTLEEVDFAIEAVAGAVARLRDPAFISDAVVAEVT
jgi:cysteine desulfurase